MRVDSLFRSAGIGLLAAVVAVVVTYLIADAVSGPLLATPAGGGDPEEVPLGGAVFGVIMGAIFGTILAVVASRIRRSAEVFVWICAFALVLYGLFALSAADSTATGIWLNIMHIAAAVPIVGLLARWLQGRAGAAANELA